MSEQEDKVTRLDLIEDICRRVGVNDRNESLAGYLRRSDLVAIQAYIEAMAGVRNATSNKPTA